MQGYGKKPKSGLFAVAAAVAIWAGIALVTSRESASAQLPDTTNITISFSSNPGTVARGENITFRIIATLYAEAPFDGAEVVFTPPPGTTFVSAADSLSGGGASPWTVFSAPAVGATGDVVFIYPSSGAVGNPGPSSLLDIVVKVNADDDCAPKQAQALGEIWVGNDTRSVTRDIETPTTVTGCQAATGTVVVEKVKDTSPGVPPADNSFFFGGTIEGPDPRTWGEVNFGTYDTLYNVATGTYTLTENPPPNGWQFVGYALVLSSTDECPTAKSAYSPGISSFTVSNLQTTHVCVMNTKGAAPTATPVTPTSTPVTPQATPVTPTRTRTPQPISIATPTATATFQPVVIILPTATPTRTPVPPTPTAVPPTQTPRPTNTPAITVSADPVVVVPAPPRTGSGAGSGTTANAGLLVAGALVLVGGLGCVAAARRRQR
jgi:hypothetical protein